MKDFFSKRRQVFLILLGITGFVFFIQTLLVIGLFLTECQPPPDVDPLRFRIFIAELDVGNMVSSVVGSLFGCFGSWLLLIYLRLNRIEHQIAELI